MIYVDWLLNMDIEGWHIPAIILYVLITIGLMIWVWKLFFTSRQKIIEISSPLSHILKDNQTYCLITFWMMRLVQALLILIFLDQGFVIILLFLPAYYFQIVEVNMTFKEFC